LDSVVGWFLSYASPDLTIERFLLSLLVAWVCGQIIGWSYAASSGVLSYSQTFVQALVLLTMLVSMITGIIGESIARAFGLAAALAVVRFRTPVKDARDAAFLFFGVSVGMAIGTGNLLIGAAASLIVSGVALTLDWTAFGSRSLAEGMLRFRFDGEADRREEVGLILMKHCRVFQLSAARVAAPGGPEELVYDINLRSARAADALLKELQATGCVTAVSLLPLARAGES
jgi:uncharacterized membrane protein YhiD involved in acid resistance